MDSKHIRQIEREGAEALLDAGASVPLFAIRIPMMKRRLTVRATMRRPNLAGLIRIGRLYTSMGVTSEEMWDFSKEEEMKFLAEHGAEVSRMIAVTLSRGRLSARWLERPLAWLIRQKMEPKMMLGAMMRFVMLTGTDPFMPIIRLAERRNPLKPRLSRDAEGS